MICKLIKDLTILKIYPTQTKKKRNSTTLSNCRKITSVEAISFTSVYMHVGDCCNSYLLQTGVKSVCKQTGHNTDVLVYATKVILLDLKIPQYFFFVHSISFLIILGF